VVAADSDVEAKRPFTSQQPGFINLRRGRPGLVQPPVADITAVSTPEERIGVEAFIERHRTNELMLTANVFDHAARMRGFELAADVLHAMN
jgi:hypothetical protein